MYRNITFLKVPFCGSLCSSKKKLLLGTSPSIGPSWSKKIKKQLPSKAYSHIVVPPKRRGGEM
jgi:hypothetical protein